MPEIKAESRRGFPKVGESLPKFPDNPSGSMGGGNYFKEPTSSMDTAYKTTNQWEDLVKTFSEEADEDHDEIDNP